MPTPSKRYSLTWHVTPDLIGIVDASGVFVDTNPAWERTLGWTSEEIESTQFFSFVHPDDHMVTEAAFEQIQRDMPVLNFENRYRHKDGSYRWLSWNAVPEGDRYFCTARDVTEAKEHAATLRTREEEARLREQFIAVLGHDLRNPLAAISAGLRLLDKRDDPALRADLKVNIQHSVDRMSALIDDLMDFARARLGAGIDLEDWEPVDLKPVLERTVQEIVMANPDATIESHIDLSSCVECDPIRLSQLASNLLSNAVAHGLLRKPVTFAANDRDGKLTISVANEAAPIPEEIREAIFKPFSRARRGVEYSGLGLGLFICAEIARAHGGSIDLYEDDGTVEFRFEMAIRRAD